MIPGMAMISSAVEPRLRGTFMTLNSAVQSASMGLAALVAGLIIGRDAQGQLTGYWMAGLLGGGGQLAQRLAGGAFAPAWGAAEGGGLSRGGDARVSFGALRRQARPRLQSEQ